MFSITYLSVRWNGNKEWSSKERQKQSDKNKEFSHCCEKNSQYFQNAVNKIFDYFINMLKRSVLTVAYDFLTRVLVAYKPVGCKKKKNAYNGWHVAIVNKIILSKF